MENKIYTKDASIVSRKIGEEFILVPIRRKTEDVESIFTLNEVGAFIWDHLDGRSDLMKIRDSIVKFFEVTQEEAEADLVSFLHQLESLGIITSK
ncbi:PqqD family protein [bacterium]|nr:PqqD family protein [bacterium]RQV97207.1 MAG: PqqD family protein [bacterium]